MCDDCVEHETQVQFIIMLSANPDPKPILGCEGFIKRPVGFEQFAGR